MTALLSFSCNITTYDNNSFGFIMHYGMLGGNILNTFEKTYTKDLIFDGTITIPFHLTSEEMDSIKSMMYDIDIFSYPRNYSSQPETKRVYMTPAVLYKLRAKSENNEVYIEWNDSYYIEENDSKANNLLSLLKTIENIIHSKPEYKAPPEPYGGYY